MSSNEPTWEQRVKALRGEYDSVRDATAMSDVTREVGNVATEITGLPAQIEQIRQRGYMFASYLERKVEVLAQQWAEVKQQVTIAIAKETARVQKQMDDLRDEWTRLELQRSEAGRDQHYGLVKRAIDDVAAEVKGARDRIRGLFGQVPTNVQQTKSQLRQIEGYLALAAESTVEWGPTEGIVLVVEAEWVQSGKDKEDPDGLLFLTDQRLIFERKEKVGGRFGFGGERVQEVMWAVPVGAITEVTAEDKGMLGRKDMVHLRLSSGDYAEITLEVTSSGIDSKWYVQQLNRVLTGEIDKERVAPVAQEVVEALKNAPTVCTTCGATLPPIVRGMTEMTCEYCGTVVRI